MGDQDWGSGSADNSGGGWGASNGNGNANGDSWGNSNGDTQPANGHDSFGTADLQAALPGDQDNGASTDPAPPLVVNQVVPDKLPGWVQAMPYDYTDAQNEWESSARIYEWDGEEGDIGPEHAELELQLFGNPASREHHGIDFTRYVLGSFHRSDS